MVGKFAKFSDYLDHLQEYTGITQDEILNGISQSSIGSAESLVKIADNLKLDAQMLYNQQIDLEALKRHHQGELNFIPDRFKHAACSRMRTMQSMLSQFKLYNLDQWVLKKLQIHPEAHDLDQEISYNAISDSFNFTSRHLSSEDFKAIGAFNAHSFLKTQYGALVHKEKTLFKKMESLFLYSALVEKNFDYKILSKGQDHLLVSTKESEKISDGIYYKNITSIPNAELRMGFVEESMRLFGGKAVATIEKFTPKTTELVFRFELQKNKFKPSSVPSLFN